MKIYILVILVLLMGCTTVLKSTKDFNNLVTINNEITSGNTSTIIKSIGLNETEILLVTHNINYFNTFVSKWKDVKALDSRSNNFQEFLQDYYVLKSKYIEIQNIIVKNWDLYTDENKHTLLEYKERAIQADNTVEYLQKNATKQEMLVQAMLFAKVVVGLIK